MKFSAAGSWFSGDWYQHVEMGAKYGFAGVEQLEWLGLDLKRAGRVLKEYGVTSTALIIQSESPEVAKYLPWTHGMVWEDSRQPFIEALKETIRAAKVMGVPNIIATTGNERTDVCREKQHEIVVETLKQMAPYANEAGVMIVLEPLNVLVNHPGHFLVTSKEGFEMIREVDSPSCRLLFDIYHQQVSEGNLIANIREGIDLIGHFHIADNPGRMEPGTGEINYEKVFQAIQETGYSRWLAFECGRTLEAGALCEKMQKLIQPFQ